MVDLKFTAAYKKTGKWVSAWIEEIPGVNTQGKTRKEAHDNLKEALILTLVANREIGNNGNKRGISRELLNVKVPA
ncbi:MAG: type II toxin-antitoxin system HicB family antitoxin [Candidatus Taylorbacteria bacterium]